MNGPPDNFVRIALIFALGGLGALSRYGLGGYIQRLFGGTFPVGTVVVNLIGCLLFAFVSTLAVERRFISHETQLVVLTGFMGAFTTFSTFAYDTHVLIHTDGWDWGLLNVGVQCIGGLLAVAVGIMLGRYMPA